MRPNLFEDVLCAALDPFPVAVELIGRELGDEEIADGWPADEGPLEVQECFKIRLRKALLCVSYSSDAV